MTGHRRPKASVSLAALFLLCAGASPVLGHGPDPVLGTGVLWDRDEVATYMWDPINPLPGWMAASFDAGAGDANASRNARAASFVRAGSSNAVVHYSGPNRCHSYGIACMDRTGMSVDGTFNVWFRPQGWVFDTYTLKWCQYYSTAPNGCYDAERVALDELGHVEVLDHHVNFADESDFLDAVVQFAGHQKPNAGWNTHVFGRCDVARLQLEYERRDPGNLVSTCVSLTTALAASVSTDTVGFGDPVKFSATLKIASTAAAEAMSGDPLSDRAVLLQRRTIGGSTWSTVTSLTPSATVEGAYSISIAPSATYDWRVSFGAPTNEGLTSATSATFRIYVSSCTGAGCPLSGAQ